MAINVEKYVDIDSQDTPIIRYVDVEKRKYGLSIDDLVGNVDGDGVYRGSTPNKPFAINFDGIIEFEAGNGFGGFAYNFRNKDFLMGVDFASVKYVRTSRLFTQAFAGSKNLGYARFPNLIGIGDTTQDSLWVFDNAFRVCPMLEELDMPKLEYVYDEYSMRSFVFGCSRLKRINMPSLKEIRYRTYGMSYFASETAIKEMKFQSLSYIGNYGLNSAFQNCLELESVWFYALTSVYSQFSFSNMLTGCSDVTVHFPKNKESTMSEWSLVVGGFGGTNTTVLFDIITSISGANEVSYQRKEKESTETATAWENDGVLYYTAGNTEPVVGDVIYSDANCTNEITTIETVQ